MITHTSSEKGRAVVPPITDANTISPFPFKVTIKVDNVEVGWPNSQELSATTWISSTRPICNCPQFNLDSHPCPPRLVQQYWWGIAAVAEGVHIDSVLCANLPTYYQYFSDELCIYTQSLLISDDFRSAISMLSGYFTSVLHRWMNTLTSLRISAPDQPSTLDHTTSS